MSVNNQATAQIGQRLVAVERPDLLTETQRQRWDSWRQERLLTSEQVPWTTVPAALKELAELREKATPIQQAQLTDIQHFLNGLCR